MHGKPHILSIFPNFFLLYHNFNYTRALMLDPLFSTLMNIVRSVSLRRTVRLCTAGYVMVIPWVVRLYVEIIHEL